MRPVIFFVGEPGKYKRLKKLSKASFLKHYVVDDTRFFNTMRAELPTYWRSKRSGKAASVFAVIAE